MGVTQLQHINIRAADVDASRDFYVRVLGLRVGDRPPFASTGYWLYLQDQPVVHLVQRLPDEAVTFGSGPLDHVAFRGIKLGAMRRALENAGIAYREAIVPRDGNVQIFVHDPDGLKIEINFSPVSA